MYNTIRLTSKKPIGYSYKENNPSLSEKEHGTVEDIECKNEVRRFNLILFHVHVMIKEISVTSWKSLHSMGRVLHRIVE